MERMITKVKWIYIVGILGLGIGWAVVWFTDLKSGYFYSGWFFAPLIICFLILFINLLIWWKPRSYKEYVQEVKIIEFVERNAGCLILAITVAIIAIQVFMGEKGILASVINYQLWALIFAILTLALIWIPSDRPDWLVRLRHIKTIFFSYAISLFIAGIIALWQGYLPGKR